MIRYRQRHVGVGLSPEESGKTAASKTSVLELEPELESEKSSRIHHPS